MVRRLYRPRVKEIRAQFLIEAGQGFGLGHLRRMQVLASALQRKDWDCHFAVTDRTVVDELNAGGLTAGVWGGLGADLEDTDLLVIDGYNYGSDLLVHWRQHARVCLIMDDMAERPLAADMLLNHNIYGHQLDYSAYSVGSVLAGPKYSLVSEEFISAHGKPRPDPYQLLISFGGTDDGCYSIPIAEGILQANSNITCHVVCSPLCKPSTGLIELELRYAGRVQLYHGANMAKLMGCCSVMVGAAGYSLIESLVAGVRPVVCATADNQRLNVAAFQRLGGRALDHYEPVHLIELALAEFQYPREQQTICDGEGAIRVVESIEKIMLESSWV